MEEYKEHKLLIQQLPAAIYTCNLEGIITYYNTAAAELWNQHPKTGQNKWNDFLTIYKSDGSSFPENENPVILAIKNAAAISMELTAKRSDGQLFHLLYSSQPVIDPNGSCQEILSVLINITKQKQAQQAFSESIVKTNEELLRQKELIETVLHSSADAICVHDKHTRLIALNKKCEEIFKIKREEVLGKTYLEIFPNGAENSDSYIHFIKALNGEHIHNVITKSNTLDRSFEVFIVPLLHNNEIYAILSVVHDITAIMKISERLQITNLVLEEKNKELERSNNELASFSYIASHDLQEPLRKIITFADKLLEIPEINTSSSTRTYLEKIILSSERMRQLIEDVLNFSRISTEEKFTKTNLNEIVNNVLTDFEQKIFEKKATIDVAKLPAIPAIKIQMRQLFHNLISNALKFTGASTTPRIQISAEPLHPAELNTHANLSKSISYVKILVKDNGIGFNQEFAEKIFMIFQRLHGNNKFPGTGIGLALCRKIADNHNGLIYAVSLEGKGTVFHIILPEKLSFIPK